jgi:hypothetical protein
VTEGVVWAVLLVIGILALRGAYFTGRRVAPGLQRVAALSFLGAGAMSAGGWFGGVLWVLPQAPIGAMMMPAWWTIDVMQWMGAMRNGADAIARLIRDVPPGLPECRSKMCRLVEEVCHANSLKGEVRLVQRIGEVPRR